MSLVYSRSRSGDLSCYMPSGIVQHGALSRARYARDSADAQYFVAERNSESVQHTCAARDVARWVQREDVLKLDMLQTGGGGPRFGERRLRRRSDRVVPSTLLGRLGQGTRCVQAV